MLTPTLTWGRGTLLKQTFAAPVYHFIYTIDTLPIFKRIILQLVSIIIQGQAAGKSSANLLGPPNDSFDFACTCNSD